MRLVSVAVAVLMAFGMWVPGAFAATASSVACPFYISDSNIMPVKDVHPGMSGYGLTTSSGIEPARFDFTVRGFTPFGPGDYKLEVKISGDNPEYSYKNHSIWEGMSGSPTCVEGKWLGIAAYSPPFNDNSVSWLTPFEDLMRDAHSASVRDALAGGTDLSSGKVSSSAGNSAANTPVYVTGFDEKIAGHWQKEFASHGISVQFMPCSSSPDNFGTDNSLTGDKLQPGSAIQISFATGDFGFGGGATLSGIMKDGTVLATGHSLFGLGQIAAPWSLVYVNGVVSGLQSSFRSDGRTGPTLGTMYYDGPNGTIGKLGENPRMVGVSLNFSSGLAKKQFNFQIAPKPAWLSPILIGMAVDSVLSSYGTLSDLRLVKVKMALEFYDKSGAKREVHLANWFANENPQSMFGTSSAQFVQMVGSMLQQLAPSAGLRLYSVKLDVSAENAAQPILEITDAHAAKVITAEDIQDGNSIPIVIKLRTPDGSKNFEAVMNLPISAFGNPATKPIKDKPGQYVLPLTISGGMAAGGATLVNKEPDNFDYAVNVLQNSPIVQNKIYAIWENADTGSGNVSGPVAPSNVPFQITEVSNPQPLPPDKLTYASPALPYIVQGFQEVDVQIDMTK